MVETSTRPDVDVYRDVALGAPAPPDLAERVETVDISERSSGRSALLVPIATTAASILVASLLWTVLGLRNKELFDVSALVSMFTLFVGGVFEPKMVPDFTSKVGRVVRGVALSVFIVAALFGAFSSDAPTVPAILSTVVVLTAACLFGTGLGSGILRRVWGAGGLRTRAVVIGTNELCRDFILELGSQPTFGVDVVGVVAPVDEHGPALKVAPRLGDFDQLPDIIEKTDASRLIVAPVNAPSDELVRILRWSNTKPDLTVYVVPRFYQMGMGLDSFTPDRVRGFPLMRLSPSTHPALGLLAKRVFDIVVSAVVLLVASPLIALTALAVRLTSPGPVLYRQTRVTKGGREFTLLKFRSMTVNDASDTEWTADDRVTPVGRFIRRVGLDETPQFYNVLRGDMSLVGPRPMRPSFIAEFTVAIPGFADRHRAQAGLTGLAQIVGFRGDTSVAERAKYDNLYIDQWSFSRDLQILFKTVWAMVQQDRYARSHRSFESQLRDLE